MNGFTDGLASLEGRVADTHHALADQMALELRELLDEWHAQPEVWDSELDSQIHEWYVNPPNVFPKKPYFSPSAAGADPRELYEKVLNSAKDKNGQPPHQGRWTRLGTATGDLLQRDLLFIEKHKPGARFRFERTDDGRPMFEDFAKANIPVKYRNKLFYLHGAPDGIMQYITDDGEIVRVGLEIKTKQTTYAQTGEWSMKSAEAKHIEQCKVYAMMYGLDYYIILYMNTSKKAWNMTEDDVLKYPDLRTFGYYFAQEEKTALLDKFVDVLEAVDQRKPPLPDLSKFTFNNYKTSIAKSLTESEILELRVIVENVRASSLKPYQIQSYVDALEFIERVRENK